MCGRFALNQNADDIAVEIGVQDWEGKDEYVPNFNIAPTQSSLVLLNSGKFDIKSMRWGLIPSWAKDDSFGSRMINARYESVTEKPAFRDLLSSQRCIAIAAGYYEWSKTPDGKQPHFISSASGSFLFLAGLWDTWKSSTGNFINSFTIITRAPFPNIEHIHDRMPAVIPQSDLPAWLEPGKSSISDAFAALENSTVGLAARPVSTFVNSVHNNGEECIRPLRDNPRRALSPKLL